MDGLGIQVRGLTVRYGSTVALDGVDLDVRPGAITGLLGRNGSGKTTLASVVASFRRPNGGTVLVDHGHGVSSSFLHLSRIDVKTGEHVAQGQVIGAVGMTGRATGPHLHWGLNWFEVRLDPLLLPGLAPPR